MPMSCTLKLVAKSAAPVRNDEVGSDFCEQRPAQRAPRELWRVRNVPVIIVAEMSYAEVVQGRLRAAVLRAPKTT
jgi:hypothetical protein